MATSQPKEVLLKKYEQYVLSRMGFQEKWEIEHRLAHIHGHSAGLKIWIVGRQRDAEIRDYFSNKEKDNRDGTFFYNSVMKPDTVDYESIVSNKTGNKNNLIITYTKK